MATDLNDSTGMIEAPAIVTGSLGLGPMLKRWTTDEYHKLREFGLIMEGASIELIDGMLVFKDRRDSGDSEMTQGDRHALAVAQLVELNMALAALGFHVRIQSPLSIGNRHEPEPDGVILPGRPVAYAGRLPASDDACVVIEVADTSLKYDRTVKKSMCATAAIPAYWIVNLQDNVIELFERPNPLSGEYDHQRIIHAREPFEVKLSEAVVLKIAGGFLI